MSDKRLRIGLNGFGRIGRCVTRILADRDDIDLGKSDVNPVHGPQIEHCAPQSARPYGSSRTIPVHSLI